MKKFILGSLAVIISGIQLAPAITLAGGRFDPSLGEATTSIQNNIDKSFPTQNGMQGASGVRDLIIYIVKKIITPVMIFIGVLLGIVGMYEIITSTKDDSQKKGFNYILWGAIGILVMVSANFLANTLVNGGIFMYDANGQLLGGVTAQMIYKKLMFPFLKLFMYIVIGILFILALLRLISILTSGKDEGAKAARTIITWNAIGILVIIFAKNIIEAIFGLENDVISANNTNLGQVGNPILYDKQVPFVYTIINYATGFIGIFLLVMIIVQAIQLLTKPTDEAMMKKMRKNFIYIVIGLVIIGTSYVVTNVFIAK